MQDGINVIQQPEVSSQTDTIESLTKRRQFLISALSGMVSAIVAGEVKAGSIKQQEPAYIEALSKIEASKEVADIPENEVDEVIKGKRTPRLVARIFQRVKDRLSLKNSRAV